MGRKRLTYRGDLRMERQGVFRVIEMAGAYYHIPDSLFSNILHVPVVRRSGRCIDGFDRRGGFDR